MKPIKIQGSVWEGAEFRILAQVVDLDNTLLVHSTDPGAYTYALNIYDLGSQTPSTAFATPSVGALLETSSQTGPEWTLDSTGYTFDFRWTKTLNDANSLVGGHTYRFEFTITTTLGTPNIGMVPVVADIKTLPRFS